MKFLLSPIVQKAGLSCKHRFVCVLKGIHVVGDLFKDNSLLSFQQLHEIFDIPKQHFFGYL